MPKSTLSTCCLTLSEILSTEEHLLVLQAAFSYLRAYVGSRRRDNQQKAAARAAAAQEAGGAMLHEYPEFLLPFLVQVAPLIQTKPCVMLCPCCRPGH